MSSIILPEFCPTSTLFLCPDEYFPSVDVSTGLLSYAPMPKVLTSLYVIFFFIIANILTPLLIALVKSSKDYSKAEKQIFCIMYAVRLFDHGNYAPNSYLPSTCCVVVMLYLPSLFSLLSLSFALFLCISLSPFLSLSSCTDQFKTSFYLWVSC